MLRTNAQSHDPSPGKVSRRSLLGGVALAVAQAQRKNGDFVTGHALAYVGTSDAQTDPGSSANGAGIHLFEMNRSTGALSARGVFKAGPNPTWLAFSPSRTHLYASNEIVTFQGAASGSVSALSIDRSDGRLTLLNTVSSQGAGPAHLSVHPSGKYVLVANYESGTVAVLPVKANGELGPATDVKQQQGNVGPARAASAPPGSFAISGHERPHAHMIQPDPAGRFVLSTDLGLDRILVWKFDIEKGTLTPADSPFVQLPPGDGPRHFAFHPDGRRLYSLQEEGSTLVRFDYDPAHGALMARQTVSSLPKGFAGSNFPSEVMISADAKFVYAANRLHDSIAWFTIGENGAVTFAGEEWTRGDYPSSFNIDPTGNFLYCCNQHSDAVTTFRVNRKTGGLTFADQYTPVGTPSMIVFLPA